MNINPRHFLSSSLRQKFTLIVCLFALTPALHAQVITLGDATQFAVLGATTVTNTGGSIITGDVGVASGTAITGFPPGIVLGGALRSNDLLSNQAQIDAETAFNQLGTLPGTDLSGIDLGGLTLTPGVYFFNDSAFLNGTLTLDGQGQSDPLFVFRTGTTFITGAGSSIVLTSGALSDNLFFAVGSSATLGLGSSMTGTIIASESITATTGASVIEGRLLALNGAVTLDTNVVTAVPEPSSSAMVLAALGLLWMRSRGRSNGSAMRNRC